MCKILITLLISILFQSQILSQKLVALVKSYDNHYGYIDNYGKIAIDTIYDDIWQLPDDMYDEYAMLPYMTRENYYFMYESIKKAFSKIPTKVTDLVPVKKGNKWGFSNFKNQLIVKPEYDKVNSFFNNRAAVQINIGFEPQWGFIDNNGNIVVQFQYLNVFDFNTTVTWVQGKNKKWGLIDLSGDVILDFNYTNPGKFYNNLSIVCLDGMFGIVNTKGEFILKPKFKELGPIQGDLIFACEKNNWGIINKSGEWLVKPFFKKDIKSKVILPIGPAPYTPINASSWFGDETKSNILENSKFLTPLVEYDKIGLFNEKGENVTDFIYSAYKPYSNGLMPVRLNGKWGYLDSLGRVAIEFKYRYAFSFESDITRVKIKNKWGFIKKDGTLISDKTFWNNYKFFGDYAKIDKHHKRGFINKDGTIIVNPEYDFAYNYSCGLVAVRKGKYWGFLDTKGNAVIKLEYEKATPFINSIAAVRIDKKWGYIDTSGKWIIEPMYKKAYSFFKLEE